MKYSIVIFIFTGLLISCSTNVPTNESKLLRDSISEPIPSNIKEIILNEFDYKCVGNEPFYQIEISEKNNHINFYNPMKQDTIHFLFAKPKVNDALTIYSVTDEQLKNKIEITIVDEPCVDGMSEKKYLHSTKIILNDKTYVGCAIKFGEQ